MEALNSTAGFSPAATSAPVAMPKRSRLKIAGRIVLVLLALMLVGHVVWGRAGSNQWELAMDKEGIKLWTLKSPGSDVIQVKAATRIKSSLAGMVKLLEDLDSCVDAKCYDAKVIEKLPMGADRYAAFVRFKFDIPGLSPRDYVLLQEHVQDPASKRLDINVIAAPNRIARDTCCVRITHLHNHWTMTPLANGELDIEFKQDTDIGGLPYPLANLAVKYGTYEILHGMQGLMNMAKYRDAPTGAVQELAAN